jgi:UDP-2,3-diacylglucosamine hydrolase
MKLSAISDVHVKTPHDEADRLLMAFFGHPYVEQSDYILLLGDIFDLMCGPHQEYLTQFHHIFEKMDALVKAGKKVMYFEGNHDVHLDQLFQQRWPQKQVICSQKPIELEVDHKKYYFSHGDEHEVDNLAYQRYKKIILSPPLAFVANALMPYFVLHSIGEKASKMSRKKGSRVFNEELVKSRFRSGVEANYRQGINFILGGHSHVKDLYNLKDKDCFYINNGYALRSKSFIYIEDHQVSFPALS